MPLAACIFVAPAVALTGEVNPFGVAEFVAHEVQVTAVNRGGRDQTNHLMQGNAAVDHEVAVILGEVPVHISVNEAENDGLVAHERLVMAFGIGDGLFIGTAVGHFPENAGGVPIFVLLFFDGLNPVIRHVHGQAIVKAKATVLKFGSQSRHAADIFSDGDGMGLDFVNQFVGQCQIADGVVVLMAVEVVAVVHKGLA